MPGLVTHGEEIELENFAMAWIAMARFSSLWIG